MTGQRQPRQSNTGDRLVSRLLLGVIVVGWCELAVGAFLPHSRAVAGVMLVLILATAGCLIGLVIWRERLSRGR